MCTKLVKSCLQNEIERQWKRINSYAIFFSVCVHHTLSNGKGRKTVEFSDLSELKKKR